MKQDRGVLECPKKDRLAEEVPQKTDHQGRNRCQREVFTGKSNMAGWLVMLPTLLVMTTV